MTTITDSKNLLFPWLLMIFDGEISQHNLLWKVEFCGFLLASNIDFGGIIVIYMQRAKMMFPNTLALIQEFSYWLLNRLRVLRLCSAHNILLYSCSFQMVSQRFCTHKHVTGLLQCVVFNFHFSVNESHSPSISHSVCQAINQTRNQIN